MGPWAPRHCRGCRWLVTPLLLRAAAGVRVDRRVWARVPDSPYRSRHPHVRQRRCRRPASLKAITDIFGNRKYRTVSTIARRPVSRRRLRSVVATVAWRWKLLTYHGKPVGECDTSNVLQISSTKVRCRQIQHNFKCVEYLCKPRPADVQVLHFFLDEISRNFWHIMRLSITNCCKVINSQKVRFFGPPFTLLLI